MSRKSKAIVWQNVVLYKKSTDILHNQLVVLLLIGLLIILIHIIGEIIRMDNVVNQPILQPIVSEPAQRKKNMTLSILSLVLGLLSIIPGPCYILLYDPDVTVLTILTSLEVITSLVAIVLGIISLVKKKGGMAMAIIGICFGCKYLYWVMCYVFAFFWLAYCCCGT